MTIQSSSPRSSLGSRSGSILRRSPVSRRVSVDCARRVLGLGGSSSRIFRSTSSNAASRSCEAPMGVTPVSSS